MWHVMIVLLSLSSTINIYNNSVYSFFYFYSLTVIENNWVNFFLRFIQKVCHRPIIDFWSPSPCHTLSPFALTPLPPCRHPNTDKLEDDNDPTFDANFNLIFAKMCIFSIQTLLSTQEATMKWCYYNF